MSSTGAVIALILILLFISTLYYYRSQLKYLGNIFGLKPLLEKKERSVGEPKSNIDPVLKCPKCGNQMERVSFLQSNVFWGGTPSPDRLFPFKDERDRFLLPPRPAIPRRPYVYRCEACGITAYFE